MRSKSIYLNLKKYLKEFVVILGILGVYYSLKFLGDKYGNIYLAVFSIFVLAGCFILYYKSKHFFAYIYIPICGITSYLIVSLYKFTNLKLQLESSHFIEIFLVFIIIILTGNYFLWKKEKKFKDVYVVVLLFILFFILSGRLYSFLNVYAEENKFIGSFFSFTIPITIIGWKYNLIERKGLQMIRICYLLYFFLFIPLFVFETQKFINIPAFYKSIIFISSSVCLLKIYYLLCDFESYWRKIIFKRVFPVIFGVFMLSFSIIYLLPLPSFISNNFCNLNFLLGYSLLGFGISLTYWVFLLISLFLKLARVNNIGIRLLKGDN